MKYIMHLIIGLFFVVTLNSCVVGGYRISAPINNDTSSTNSYGGSQCIQNNFGGQVCGFNCIKAMSGAAACASTPDQRCVADNYGNIACGYGCVKSAFKAACADRPWKNCVMNAHSDVTCGRNCRIDAFNQVRCDR